MTKARVDEALRDARAAGERLVTRPEVPAVLAAEARLTVDVKSLPEATEVLAAAEAEIARLREVYAHDINVLRVAIEREQACAAEWQDLAEKWRALADKYREMVGRHVAEVGTKAADPEGYEYEPPPWMEPR